MTDETHHDPEVPEGSVDASGQDGGEQPPAPETDTPPQDDAQPSTTPSERNWVTIGTLIVWATVLVTWLLGYPAASIHIFITAVAIFCLVQGTQDWAERVFNGAGSSRNGHRMVGWALLFFTLLGLVWNTVVDEDVRIKAIVGVNAQISALSQWQRSGFTSNTAAQASLNPTDPDRCPDGTTPVLIHDETIADLAILAEIWGTTVEHLRAVGNSTAVFPTNALNFGHDYVCRPHDRHPGDDSTRHARNN